MKVLHDWSVIEIAIAKRAKRGFCMPFGIARRWRFAMWNLFDKWRIYRICSHQAC